MNTFFSVHSYAVRAADGGIPPARSFAMSDSIPRANGHVLEATERWCCKSRWPRLGTPTAHFGTKLKSPPPTSGAFVFGKASDDMIHHVTVRPATLPRRAGSQVCRWGEYREVGALWKKDLVFDRTECPFPSSKAVVSRLLIKSQNNLECLALLGPCLRQISPD